jgi:hypothetical protein
LEKKKTLARFVGGEQATTTRISKRKRGEINLSDIGSEWYSRVLQKVVDGLHTYSRRSKLDVIFTATQRRQWQRDRVALENL